MTYTDKKPTEPGWYWCRLNETDKCIVIYFDGSKATKCGGSVEIDISNFPDGQFAGPIPEPVEPMSEAEAGRLIEELKAAVMDRGFAEEFIKAQVGAVVNGVVGKYVSALVAEAAKKAKQ